MIDEQASELATKALELRGANIVIYARDDGSKSISVNLVIKGTQVLSPYHQFIDEAGAMAVIIRQLRATTLEYMLDYLKEHDSKGLESIVSKATLLGMQQARAVYE